MACSAPNIASPSEISDVMGTGRNYQVQGMIYLGQYTPIQGQDMVFIGLLGTAYVGYTIFGLLALGHFIDFV